MNRFAYKETRIKYNITPDRLLKGSLNSYVCVNRIKFPRGYRTCHGVHIKTLRFTALHGILQYRT